MIRFGQLLLVLGGIAGSMLHAQTGMISGTVTDSSGAGVPDAAITAKNQQTGTVRNARTDSSGTYSLPSVPVGRYILDVAKQGFASLRVPDIELTVAQSLTVNGTLQLGAVAQTVDVSASSAPALDLDTAQISNVVEQKRIQDLPLLTRDPYSLVLLSPGTEQTNSILGGFSVNGQRERNNNFLLDGVDNNDASVPGSPGGLVSLNPDSTQEFRVITNNFLPEYGRNTGAIVDIVTKSGNNSFHGSAYEFNRVAATAARDFFNRTPDPQNPFVRNDFGAAFGGPIWKDHTFFFVNSEWQRFRTTLTGQAVVPSAAFKSGIFTYQGQRIDLTTPGSPDNAQGLPLNPTTQKILALYPNPNGPAVDDIRGIYFFPTSSRTNTASVTYRMDHRFSDKYAIFARYSYGGFDDPDAGHDDILPGLGATGTNQQTNAGTLNFSATLLPTLINEFRFGFNRADNVFSCGGQKTIDQYSQRDAFGFGSDYLFNTANGTPLIANFGCTNLADSNGQFQRIGTWHYVDNLSWVRGKHSFKFGAEFRNIFDDGYDNFSARPTIDFTAFGNFGVPVVNVGGTCDPNSGAHCGSEALQTMAAVLLGEAGVQQQTQFFNASGQRIASDYRRFLQHEYGAFAQDVWKLRPNFTLNVGLRYEFNGVPFERQGQLSNLYQNPAGAAPLTFTLVGPGTHNQLYSNDYRDFEPRIGVSWDPFNNGKTAVRAGYGIFHDRIFGNLFTNLKSNPPFIGNALNLVGGPLSGVAPPATLPAPSATVANGSFIGVALFDKNLRTPYTGSWNVGVQRELAGGVVLDVDYVGSSSHRQIRSLNGNQANPALIAALLANGVSPSALQGSGMYFRGDVTYNTALFEPAVEASIGNATYNALQTRVAKRLSSGLEFNASYSWSHAIDDSADPIYQAGQSRGFPRNSFNLKEERGSSEFDLRHRLVLDYIYEAPFGPGKRWLTSGVGGHILGGWEVAGISTFESGRPYDIFSSRDAEHTGNSSRPDLIGNPAIPSGADKTQTGPPASAFAPPPFGRAGTVGRNTFTGPRYYNTDVDLIRRFRLTERWNLQFRAEAYNVFNQVQFALPGNVISDPGTFGVSTAELSRGDGTSAARQLQLALKLEF